MAVRGEQVQVCFDPRPRAGGDGISKARISTRHVFRSTPPRGGRRAASASRPVVDVSIHAPARGATFARFPVSRHGKGFDPRPRARGRLVNEIAPVLMKAFRSTPPRGGDERHVLWKVAKGVSIHAPARGATGPARELSARIDVSIHAPARGATWRKMYGATLVEFRSTPRAGGDDMARIRHDGANCFDPRPRAGGDLRFRQTVASASRVSIHAPARGATRRIAASRELPPMFRSTPPRGGRPRETQTPDQRRKTFRSTPPRGGRLGAYQMHAAGANVSIHAPARGATCSAPSSRRA